MKLFFLLITATLFSQRALSGEYTAQIECAKSLRERFLDKNSKNPGSLDEVGYMVEGSNKGQKGFFVYRDNEAYFVAYPKNAKEHVNELYPNAEPAIFIWAKIPQGMKSKNTDNFKMTLQGGRVVSYADEIGFNIGLEKWPETKKLFRDYMVTVEAKSVQGNSDAQDTLLAELANAIRRSPKHFKSDLRLAQGRRLVTPNPDEYYERLKPCSKVANGKLTPAIEEAKGEIIVIASSETVQKQQMNRQQSK